MNAYNCFFIIIHLQIETLHGIMNDTNAIYIGMQFNLFNNGTSNGVDLIMCILLIKTFHIIYMNIRLPISLHCNSLNVCRLSKTL